MPLAIKNTAKSLSEMCLSDVNTDTTDGEIESISNGVCTVEGTDEKSSVACASSAAESARQNTRNKDNEEDVVDRISKLKQQPTSDGKETVKDDLEEIKEQARSSVIADISHERRNAEKRSKDLVTARTSTTVVTAAKASFTAPEVVCGSSADSKQSQPITCSKNTKRTSETSVDPATRLTENDTQDSKHSGISKVLRGNMAVRRNSTRSVQQLHSNKKDVPRYDSSSDGAPACYVENGIKVDPPKQQFPMEEAPEDGFLVPPDLLRAGSPGETLPGAIAVLGLGSGTDGQESSLEFQESTRTEFQHHLSTDTNSCQELVIVANLVEDPPAIIEAEAVTLESLKQLRRRTTCRAIRCTIFFAVLTIIIVVMIIVLTKKNNKPFTLSPTKGPTLLPSVSPTELPSASPTSNIRNLLESVDGFLPRTSTAFEIDGSPQSKALMWLEQTHSNVLELEEERFVQRFAMATLYYSTSGEMWGNEEEYWLSPERECEWFSSEPKFYPTEPRSHRVCSVLGESVKTLVLKSNGLKGPLPPEISLLSNLVLLDLTDNDLSTLPSELGALTSLTELILSSNDLTGHLPSSLGLLTALKNLELNNNNLSGTIPSETYSFTRLTSLSMMGNKFQGEISSNIGLLTDLKVLELDRNQLSGSIPFASNLTAGDFFGSIERLSLSSNSLKGTIPIQINLPETLQFLDLHHNEFTGSLPSGVFSGLTALTSLNLRENTFSGSLPSDLFLSLKALNTLDLGDNKFSDPLPSDLLSSLEKLTSLNLEDNKFSGPLPLDLFLSLKVLTSLNMYKNKFSSSLPPALFSPLTALKTLSLERNKFVGSLPSDTLSSLTALTNLSIRKNKFSGILPSNLFSSLAELASLDLSDNLFTGLSSDLFNSLTKLRFLKLSDNKRLSGSLPTGSFSTLTALNELLLDDTNLSGLIPIDLCQLRNQNLETLKVECVKVSCSCCGDTCPVVLLDTENCPAGQSALQVHVTTDRSPEETTWDLVDEASGQTLLQGGPYSDVFTTFRNEACISDETCTIFTIRDASANGICCNTQNKPGTVGYDLYLGGNRQIARGGGLEPGNFLSIETTGINTCAPTSSPSVTPAPSIAGACPLCQNDQNSMRGNLLIPRTLGYETCSDIEKYYSTYILSPGRCNALQLTFGNICGCENPITTSVGVCRLCGDIGAILPDPYKITEEGASCLELELQASFITDNEDSFDGKIAKCTLFQEAYETTCCTKQ